MENTLSTIARLVPLDNPLHFLKGALYLKTAQQPVVAQLVKIDQNATKFPEHY